MESETGRGSTFSILLPVNARKATQDAQDAPDAHKSNGADNRNGAAKSAPA